MEQTSPPTPAPDPVCQRCGGPAPWFDTGLTDLPRLQARYCAECQEIVDAEEAARERRRQVGMLLARAGSSPRVRDWSLATLPDDELGRKLKGEGQEWLEGFLAGSRRNLLVFGPVGTCKTGLAWSLVRAACEQLHDALLLNFRDYLWDSRQRFAERLPQDEGPQHIGLLALDDLGAERLTEWTRDELATLVERRHMHRLPTIVTSNHDPTELAEKLGQDDLVTGGRIVSRLQEDAVQIRTFGIDRRIR